MSLDDLSCRPDAFRAQKTPVPVAVVFAAADGVLETREGAVRYQVGDALLTGVEGERWPVSRKRFLETYVPRPTTMSGENGCYEKRLLTVWAWRTDVACDIPLSGGRGILHAMPGDVLVQQEPGELIVVGASIFEKTYYMLP